MSRFYLNELILNFDQMLESKLKESFVYFINKTKCYSCKVLHNLDLDSDSSITTQELNNFDSKNLFYLHSRKNKYFEKRSLILFSKLIGLKESNEDKNQDGQNHKIRKKTKYFHSK